jgi:hypothetical protein
MKTPLFLLTILGALLFSCASQKEVVSTHTLTDKQFKGTLLQLPKRTKEGVLEEKEFYLKTEETKYFIKLKESKVSDKELLKFIDKEIIVEGEIKNGKWEEDQPGSLATNTSPVKGRTGDYLIIDKLLKEKDLNGRP